MTSVISAANGVGKTALGSNIVANICFETKNPYFKGLPVFDNFPYPKRGRIASDPTTIKETIIDELHKFFPKGRYLTKKGSKAYESKWVTDTGFKFDILTYDQAPKEFESSTLGWAWFDEPPPFAIYKATVARMRLGGLIFITQTPLTGSAWLFDNLVASPDRVDLKEILKKYPLKTWTKEMHQKWKEKFSQMNIDEKLGL